MARKKVKPAIDSLLEKVPPGIKAEFLAWAQSVAHCDIQARLNEMGQDYDAFERSPDGEPIQISLTAVSLWYLGEFAAGEKAKLLNEISRPYVGINPKAAMHGVLGSAVSLLNLALPLMDEEFLAKLAIDSPDSLFHNVMVLMKEIRSASAALNNLEVIRQRSELELAGGYRVVAIALNMAKDKPQEAILQEFLEGAVKQLETEV